MGSCCMIYLGVANTRISTQGTIQKYQQHEPNAHGVHTPYILRPSSKALPHHLKVNFPWGWLRSKDKPFKFLDSQWQWELGLVLTTIYLEKTSKSLNLRGSIKNGVKGCSWRRLKPLKDCRANENDNDDKSFFTQLSKHVHCFKRKKQLK